MVCRWKWIKRCLFAPRSNKVSNKIISLESNLCDYSDAYILFTGNITSEGNDTKAAFKNCAPFAQQKSVILLLIVQMLLILQCQCTIWLNIVTIILTHLVVYGNLKETNSLKKIMKNFLILGQLIRHLLNTNQTLLAPFQMVEEKME